MKKVVIIVVLSAFLMYSSGCMMKFGGTRNTTGSYPVQNQELGAGEIVAIVLLAPIAIYLVYIMLDAGAGDTDDWE